MFKRGVTKQELGNEKNRGHDKYARGLGHSYPLAGNADHRISVPRRENMRPDNICLDDYCTNEVDPGDSSNETGVTSISIQGVLDSGR